MDLNLKLIQKSERKKKEYSLTFTSHRLALPAGHTWTAVAPALPVVVGPAAAGAMQLARRGERAGCDDSLLLHHLRGGGGIGGERKGIERD